MTDTRLLPPAPLRLRQACLRLRWALLLALAGCVGPDPSTLRAGISVYPPYELMVLARESGYFRDAGLDLRLIEFGDLSDALRAFEQGKLDGLATTLVEVLVSRSAGARDLPVVQPISASEGSDMVLAHRSVASMRALKGQRVGLETSSLGHCLLARALERHGTALADIVLVSIEQDAMAQGLASGAVSAVVTNPPHAGAMLADPRVHRLFSSRDLPGEVLDVFAFDRSVLDGRKRELQPFLAAMDRAAERLARDRIASCAIMARRERLQADVFCASLEQGTRLMTPPRNGQTADTALALRTAVQTVHRTLTASGLVEGRPEIADCLQVLTR